VIDGEAVYDRVNGTVTYLNGKAPGNPIAAPASPMPAPDIGPESAQDLEPAETGVARDVVDLEEDLCPIQEEACGFAGPARLQETLDELAGADAVVLDFETTALTAYEAPTAPSAAQKIGNATIKELRSDGCSIDPRPRARILSLHVPDGYRVAFDLDLLSGPEKEALAGGLHDKVWVGHNLSFDYAWMLTLNPGVRPRRIIDTMLLATTHRPEALYEMQAALVQGRTVNDPHIHHALWEYVQGKMARKRQDDDGGALSLQSLSLLYLQESLDKSYQKPHNWMVDRLTRKHWDYCMGDVEIPLRIARKLLDLPDHASVARIISAVDGNARAAPAYRIMETALHTIARMHHMGVPWSAERAATLDAELDREAREAAEKLLEIAPGLGRPIEVSGKPTKKDPDPEPRIIHVMEDLLSPSKGLTAPVKRVLAGAIARETGRSTLLYTPPDAEEDPESGDTIKLDAKQLAFDYPGSQIVKLLAAVQGAVKERAMLSAFATHASSAPDGRIHPLTGISTVTGRTSATNPSLQQVPRDGRFRGVFAARPGYRIVATDFSSIELRIAAALGVRAWEVLSVVEDVLRKGRDSRHYKSWPRIKSRIGWILDKCPDLVEYLKSEASGPPDGLIETQPPVVGEASIEDYARSAACDLAKWVSRLRAATGGDPERLPFRAVYRHDLDPHLLTAIAMRAQSGDFDLRGMPPLQYLKSLSAEEIDALKKRMKDARQAAKAVNFGALYGQQPTGLHRYGVVGYGLTWTERDAAEAHAEWFRLYPEIGLWHWLIRRFFVRKKQPILNPYKPVEADLTGKIYCWSTLSGRKVLSSKLTSAANYQDQGTGAEIALLAIGNLPSDVQAMLINFVHDELVLEVPESRLEEVVAVVEKTMVEAANMLLLPYGVPAAVETSVGDAWVH
jgi:DNA polymerase-1